ncbi:MAG: Tar ligand binding domain-containing protein, partial [Helicobacteraceae bacterium]|nr:Tar ligand binding domain-containing protein [Helicobacteraceae bacterium]
MGFLDRMILRSKLVMLSGVLVAGLLLVGVIGVIGINQWQDDMMTIGDTNLPKVMQVYELNFQRRNVAALAYNVYQYQNWDATEINKPVGDLLKGRLSDFKAVDKTWEEFIATAIDDAQCKELRAKVIASYAKWREVSLLVEKAMQEVVDNSDAAKQRAIFQNYEKTMSQTAELSSAFEKDLTALLTRVTDVTMELVDNAQESSKNYTRIIIAVLAGVLAIGVLLAVVIVRSISKSITDGVLSISEANSQVLTAAD